MLEYEKPSIEVWELDYGEGVTTIANVSGGGNETEEEFDW